jgi:hypothetical protein
MLQMQQDVVLKFAITVKLVTCQPLMLQKSLNSGHWSR